MSFDVNADIRKAIEDSKKVDDIRVISVYNPFVSLCINERDNDLIKLIEMAAEGRPYTPSYIDI